MKFALLVLALLGGLWGARALGGEGDVRGAGELHATFFDDGSPRLRARLAGGELHGPAQSWHRGGELASMGDYAHGERRGPWRFWREDGTLDESRSGIYAADARVGPLAE